MPPPIGITPCRRRRFFDDDARADFSTKKNAERSPRLKRAGLTSRSISESRPGQRYFRRQGAAPFGRFRRRMMSRRWATFRQRDNFGRVPPEAAAFSLMQDEDVADAMSRFHDAAVSREILQAAPWRRRPRRSAPMMTHIAPRYRRRENSPTSPWSPRMTRRHATPRDTFSSPIAQHITSVTAKASWSPAGIHFHIMLSIARFARPTIPWSASSRRDISYVFLGARRHDYMNTMDSPESLPILPCELRFRLHAMKVKRRPG